MDRNLKFGIIGVILFVSIIITIIIIINKIKNVNKKSVKVLSAPYHNLDDRNGSLIVPSRKIPISQNRTDQTYDFWLYLADKFEVSTGYKMVFIRDISDHPSGTVPKDASPIVCLDKNMNRLLVAIPTNALRKALHTLEEVFAPGAVNQGFLVSYIETIPLQKWTQVIVMLKDDKLRLYLNLNIYSAVSTTELPSGNALIKMNEGSLYIRDSMRIVSRGYISNFRYYNHVLSPLALKNNYTRGPMPSNWLKWFGLNQYSVCSPFNKVS